MKQPPLMQRILWSVLPAAVVAFYIGGTVIYPRLANPSPKFPHAVVTIRHTHGGVPLNYNMEIATTPKEQSYGLMFRRSLAPNAGMLFLWDHDQPISMWMKNTYIPLDMLFVEKDGTIEKITTHTVPFDLTPLPSGEPVRAVIEIGAGEAGRLGIQAGDKVVFPDLSGTP